MRKAKKLQEKRKDFEDENMAKNLIECKICSTKFGKIVSCEITANGCPSNSSKLCQKCSLDFWASHVSFKSKIMIFSLTNSI